MISGDVTGIDWDVLLLSLLRQDKRLHACA